jgi:NAD(P)H-hydrate repair Nnr-like enzyme with NAD(P)H-hydrate dehydratase domain
VKHVTVGIPYCLFGGLLIFAGIAKMGNAAYAQALACLAIGACLEIAGLSQLRLLQRR